MIKLDANELPWDWPAGLKADLFNEAASLEFNRYDDCLVPQLKEALARREGVSPDQVTLGNGSDELILNFLLAFGLGRRVVFPAPTFVMYSECARVLGLSVTKVPLLYDFQMNARGMLDHLAQGSGVCFICNPNNPTGNLFDAASIKTVMDAAYASCIDEAYYEFSGVTLKNEVLQRDNAIVVRTFSKAYAIAALRVGYAIGSKSAIEKMERVRLPYNMSAFSTLAALRVLSHAEHVTQAVSVILKERDKVVRGLARLGLSPRASSTNFVLFRSPGERTYDYLKENGVLVRCYPGEPMLDGYLRVSVGSPEENDRFLHLLEGGVLG
ncbi:MAG: histidinol-phosphate transaminase [Bacillota bacterium]